MASLANHGRPTSRSPDLLNWWPWIKGRENGRKARETRVFYNQAQSLSCHDQYLGLDTIYQSLEGDDSVDGLMGKTREVRGGEDGGRREGGVAGKERMEVEGATTNGEGGVVKVSMRGMLGLEEDKEKGKR